GLAPSKEAVGSTRVAPPPGERLIGPKELLRKVRTALYDWTQTVRLAVAEHEGAHASCKDGCAYCCYQKVIIDLGQGALIYLYLHDRWTPALELRLLEADQLLTGATHADWLAQRRPCPFLQEIAFGAGRCSIY